MTTDAYDPRTIAAVAGGATFVWYAMPDLIRWRPVRAILKVGLLAGIIGSSIDLARSQGIHATEVWEEFGPRERAITVGALAAGTALTVVAERATFAFGERRRSQGKRLAHTLPALGLAALSAASVGLPDQAGFPAQ